MRPSDPTFKEIIQNRVERDFIFRKYDENFCFVCMFSERNYERFKIKSKKLYTENECLYILKHLAKKSHFRTDDPHDKYIMNKIFHINFTPKQKWWQRLFRREKK